MLNQDFETTPRPRVSLTSQPGRGNFYWLRPRDDMTVAHDLDRCDQIRRQRLGVTRSGGRGYTSPTPEDVPLRAWMEEHDNGGVQT